VTYGFKPEARVWVPTWQAWGTYRGPVDGADGKVRVEWEDGSGTAELRWDAVMREVDVNVTDPVRVPAVPYERGEVVWNDDHGPGRYLQADATDRAMGWMRTASGEEVQIEHGWTLHGDECDWEEPDREELGRVLALDAEEDGTVTTPLREVAQEDGHADGSVQCDDVAAGVREEDEL
jgi:hypothetical protein